jgi:hypothetical protein
MRNINVFATDGQGPRWVNTALGLRYTGARLEYTAIAADELKDMVIKLSGTRPFNYNAGLWATASRLDGSASFTGLTGSELADSVTIENVTSWQTKGYSSTATVTKVGFDCVTQNCDFDTGDVATPLQNVTPGGADVLVSSITIRYRPGFAGNVLHVLFPSSVDSSTFEAPEPAPSLLLLVSLLAIRRRSP